MFKRYFTIATLTVVLFLISGCGDNSTNEISEEMNAPASYTATLINANPINSDTIEVYWNYNKNVKLYILNYKSLNDNLFKSISLSPEATRYKMENLNENTLYKIELMAIYSDGTKKSIGEIEAKTATTNLITQSDGGPGV